MTDFKKKKALALVRRELQEYRNSLVLTPLVVAGIFILLMLSSVLLANRIVVVGDSVLDILNDKHAEHHMNITITVNEDEVTKEYRVTDEPMAEGSNPEEWNFSRDWQFNPQRGEKGEDTAQGLHKEIESLNPLLNAVHAFFLLLMLGTSINYLLGTFHQDRRDRSILFWKSLPVSEGQEIAAKMATVSLLVPAVYVGVSMVTQLATVALSILTVLRMDMDPMQMILGNIDFVSLFRGQLVGLLIWVLWTAPFYAWLLLASTAARRSPLFLALALPAGLMILERLFIGSDHLDTAIGNHIPHPGIDGATALGFYFAEPQWWSLDFFGMLLGLVVAAVLLLGTAWFRKHRFEI